MNKNVKKLKNELQDLADQELAIRSRKKQLLDILIAETGDDKYARRLARVAFYEIEKNAARRTRRDRFEFLINDNEDDDPNV